MWCWKVLAQGRVTSSRSRLSYRLVCADKKSGLKKGAIYFYFLLSSVSSSLCLRVQVKQKRHQQVKQKRHQQLHHGFESKINPTNFHSRTIVYLGNIHIQMMRTISLP